MDAINKLEEYGLTERYKIESTMYKEYKLARVIAQYKGLYKVVTDNGIFPAEISGKLQYELEEKSMYPTVGDFVMVKVLNEDSNLIIHNILTRKSIVERKSISDSNQMQAIAVNIDIIFICMSLDNNYNLNRLERYLAVVWDSKAKPVIILTKADLSENVEKCMLEVERVSLYSDTIVTSMFDKETIEKIGEYLKTGITAAFIGSSGVGKTTIINDITNNEIKTQELGKANKGKHTTTNKEMYKSRFGGVVIDTPGMREIGVDKVDLSNSFSDIEDLALNCKYRDCTHTVEEQCAILDAINRGELEERRLINYLKIKNENSYEGLNSKEIEIKKHERMFKDVGGMKNARKFIKNNKKR